MLKREDIQYRNFWVRLICCVAVAIALANAVHFRALDAWEAVADALLFGGAPAAVALSRRAQILIVFAVCLPPSVLRIDRPLAMAVLGAGLVAAYALPAVLLNAPSGARLPLVAPLLCVVGATTFMGAMAWSEERLKRRRLEQLEAAKQRFTDMLVHDLRKRMSSILTSFSVIEGALDRTQSRTGDLIETIRASARRMLTQIDDLVAIRRIQEGALALHREALNLGGLLRESVEEMRAAARMAGAEIDLEPGPDAAAFADRNVLSRVIANLLWNAVQHASAGTRIAVGHSAEAEGVRFHVANRGPTIPPARRQTLFRGFASGKDGAGDADGGGTGLGLTFCRLAAEAHGGDIRIESPWPGHEDGVMAVVRLPVPPALQA